MILSALLLLFSCLSSVIHCTEAAGYGLALGGSQGIPVVVWQFDQSTRKVIGPARGLRSFHSTGVPPLGNPLIDCAVSNDGTKAWVASSDAFLTMYVLSAAGPRISRRIALGRQSNLAGGASFQSLNVSPDGRHLAVCGNLFAKGRLQQPHGALWLVDTVSSKVSMHLSDNTGEYCASATFCSSQTVVASFQNLTSMSNQLIVYAQRAGRWSTHLKAPATRGNNRVVLQMACATSPIATLMVARGINSPIIVESYSVPGLVRTGQFVATDVPRSFVISVALDVLHARVLVRTNSSVYLVNYKAASSGAISAAYTRRLDIPCTNCYYPNYFTYFGVHSGAISIPKYGSTAFLTGPRNQLVALNLSTANPAVLPSIPLGISTFGVSAVCLQGA